MNAEKKTSAAQLRAAQKYKREKVKRITVEFSPAETELWDHVSKQPKKQTYIKGLIRADKDKPQGRWAFIGDACVCSVCHKASIVDYYFCPECGTEMERSGEDA